MMRLVQVVQRPHMSQEENSPLTPAESPMPSSPNSAFLPSHGRQNLHVSRFPEGGLKFLLPRSGE